MFTNNGDNNIQQGFAVEKVPEIRTGIRENVVSAGYLMGTLPFNKFNLTAGLRVENFNQTLTSYKGDSTRNVTPCCLRSTWRIVLASADFSDWRIVRPLIVPSFARLHRSSFISSSTTLSSRVIQILRPPLLIT